MKSRPRLIKFRAVLLVLCLTSVALAQTKSAKSNAWINGTWEGTGYQTDEQSTWTMLFTAGGRKFSIEYPSLNCGGRWQLVSINTYRAHFRERLDHGQTDCTDNGRVTIHRLGNKQILFLYTLAGSREVTASAVLNRKRQKAEGSRQ
jgi:hypothetical protein